MLSSGVVRGGPVMMIRRANDRRLDDGGEFQQSPRSPRSLKRRQQPAAAAQEKQRKNVPGYGLRRIGGQAATRFRPVLGSAFSACVDTNPAGEDNFQYSSTPTSSFFKREDRTFVRGQGWSFEKSQKARENIEPAVP